MSCELIQKLHLVASTLFSNIIPRQLITKTYLFDKIFN